MMYKNQKIIVANWKMNPVSFTEADNLLNTIKKGIKKSDNTNIIICPPAIYLAKIKSNASLELGIQNIFWEDQGAFTGEISCKMAKNFGVDYAIIGHSERRKYARETDEIVNAKIKSAQKNGIKPILCIGETLSEKNQDLASDVITTQLQEAFVDMNKSKASTMIIAYEPIWAIGSGVVPTIDEIMSAELLIRKIITKLYDRPTAEKVFVLYGGSVNSQNAFDIVNKTGMNGLLVGGASLNASEFLRIVNLFG
ncbi:triose-phosphate isomerase [Patescibacteria group bacterium]|nr:triose-phosphate isomerase [Patescibacteria group bacterium]